MNSDQKHSTNQRVRNAMDNEDIFEKLYRCIASTDSSNTSPIFEKFSNLKTLPDQVDLILDLLANFNLLPHYIKDCKNNEKSQDLRMNGNKLFTLKKDERALEMYTNSIALAEIKSENLGLAYANRSAVLFKLGFFKECLRDIERSLQNNYPDSLKHKLEQRRKSAQNLVTKQKQLLYHQTIPQIDVTDKSTSIECASNSVEIKIDPTQGRHLVAVKDIAIGELIAVEIPTFAVLTHERWCHCYHCLNLCYDLIPCKSCTKALFCSPKCRSESEDYHKYECPILATIESLGYNSCRLSPLRIGIHTTIPEILQVAEEDTDNIYKSGRYKEIHQLVTNEDSRSEIDIFERATCTALFYKLLKDHTDFFTKDIDAKLIFVTLVFQHLQTMACNFHDINELSLNSDGIYEDSPIGSGAYSFLSLFNHSCTPNVCRASYGTVICVSAIETIRKGQQLFDNYGYHFAIHPKPKRQAALKKQYFFYCNCMACIENWDMVTNLKRLNIRIPAMDHHENLGKADLEVAKKIRPSVIKDLEKIEKNIPCYEFCQLQEILKQCDAIFGNVRRSLK